MSRARLVASAAAVSVLLAAAALTWHAARFGWSDADARARVERDLTARVRDRARLVATAATRAARLADAVAAATASQDRLPELFTRLNEPTAADPVAASTTIWIRTGQTSAYRALAWTDGPSESLDAGTLARAPALLVAAGASGLRLVYVQPILREGVGVGVAAAESPLSLAAPVGRLVQRYEMVSSVGLVSAMPATAPVVSDLPNSFTVLSAEAQPLVRLEVPPSQIDQARRTFRWRAAAVVLLPWLAVLAIELAALVRRRRAARNARGWLTWTLPIAGLMAIATWAAQAIAGAASLPAARPEAIVSVGALALAALVAGSAWHLTRPWRARSARSVAALAAHLAGGLATAAAVYATVWLWQGRITAIPVEQSGVPVLPGTASAAGALTALLLAQVAAVWGATAILGAVAVGARVSWASRRAWLPVLLWFAPLAAMLPALADGGPDMVWGALVMTAGAAAFGLSAAGLRRLYRRTSEARRLMLQFGALVAPILLTYPLASVLADRGTRELIASEYLPATQAAQQPDRLVDILASARADLDALLELPGATRVFSLPPAGSEQAFPLWSQTTLARDRVPSQIELYGPDRTLISRFSLNVPELGALSRNGDHRWPGSGCDWEAFGEVARFGAGEQRLLHAERGVCDPTGALLGAIVVRIIPDYRTLPFVSSANPYYDALGSRDARAPGARVPELQVVVYGWSLRPLFTSGRVIWRLDEALAGRLNGSREPFWTTQVVDGRTYHVFLQNDRGGIYAAGYPVPTALTHATRLSESAALLTVLFVMYLGLATAAAPFLGKVQPSLARLFNEIRASFYRKLFLFFVVAAIGPVVLFAVAFGSYMTERLRADVESEAGSVALQARRVLDELTAAQAPTGQSRSTPTDDDLVWIRQIVGQDVNLFNGPDLRATSQRDLFDSGLLASRTPASVYRQVALDRRPVFVAEDRIGTFRYLVAAAPVPGLGREAVLTVPLASRQREIERQIDDLSRGVLAGTVILVLFAAALGASVAARVSDPVARLTRATRLVAAGRYDERIAADTADELGRLVDDFNTMTRTLVTQREELARTNQLKAWAEMARQVAHEIKNPLTPIQLAAEHLQRVHDDHGRPLGPIVEQCLTTILRQVSLLRRIASEFSTFAGEPTARIEAVDLPALLRTVVEPYQVALPAGMEIRIALLPVPRVRADRTLLSRAVTNLVENALQAMPGGGRLDVRVRPAGDLVEIEIADTGVGMDAENVGRAFEPYFSTKTAGSGLGLANARRNVELCGGRITLASEPGRGTTVTVTLSAARPAAPAAV